MTRARPVRTDDRQVQHQAGKEDGNEPRAAHRRKAIGHLERV